MDRVKYLVIGAGISGLAFAEHLDHLGEGDLLICEADEEIGGYCKTIKQDGFIWDYSGHFFHFKHPEIEEHLVSRMGDQRILKVNKDSRILWEDSFIDFPFQKNIHQLPKDDFIDCLHSLYFKPESEPESFKEMLYAKFGRGIAERFLIPYNEKLYATDLATLDVDAMGRFFPYASVEQIIANFRRPDNASYNSTFTYPEGGAIQYVHALKQGVDERGPGAARIALGERVEAIDLRRKVARTSRREVAFDYLISSAPFNRLLGMSSLEHDEEAFTWNKVLVFNLGFDKKGMESVHWVYVPQRELCFYRVGFYDNIFGTDRMSLYVELGRPRDAELGPEEVERLREHVLLDLREAGLVRDQELVSWHSVLLDPAYVHITSRSNEEVARLKRSLAARGVYSIGRYGSWTYCSIEDNIIEARALADTFNALGSAA